MSVIKGIMLQVSVICSFVCIITKILDWYNPYMDFSGHVWYIQICLYVTVIILALMAKYNRFSQIKNRNGRNDKQHSYERRDV